MFQKLNSQLRIETIAFLKVICFGFFFSVLLANCTSEDKGEKKADSVDGGTKPSYVVSIDSLNAIINDTSNVNWLDLEDQPAWDSVVIDADPDDWGKIEEKLDKIFNYYLPGALAEYGVVVGRNDPNNVIGYKVGVFWAAERRRSPLQYRIVAFLNPPATKADHSHEDTHVVPHPPPPPGR